MRIRRLRNTFRQHITFRTACFPLPFLTETHEIMLYISSNLAHVLIHLLGRWTFIQAALQLACERHAGTSSTCRPRINLKPKETSWRSDRTWYRHRLWNRFVLHWSLPGRTFWSIHFFSRCQRNIFIWSSLSCSIGLQRVQFDRPRGWGDGLTRRSGSW